MGLIRTKIPILDSRNFQYHKCNFSGLKNMFRASLEAICEILVFTIRCKVSEYPYDENKVAQILKSVNFSASGGLYSIILTNDSPTLLVNDYRNTPYRELLEYSVKSLRENREMAFNERNIVSVKIWIDMDSCIKPASDEEVPLRYRVGVSFVLESDPLDYYSEYWEDMGWFIMSSEGFTEHTVKMFLNIYKSSFIKPIIDLNYITYDSNLNLFRISEFSHGQVVKLRILDTSNGIIFDIDDQKKGLKSVSTPMKFMSVESTNPAVIKDKLRVTYDCNGVSRYYTLRSIRPSKPEASIDSRQINSLLAKILTFLYQETYLQTLVQLAIPNNFSRANWKSITSFIAPNEMYRHAIGTEIVIDFDEIINIPTDELNRLGVSAMQIISDTRNSYSWFDSNRWQLDWNQVMQRSNKILEEFEITFGFNKYKVDFKFTPIESMFYFIMCLQRYFLMTYCKLLSVTERQSDKISVSIVLGFSRFITNAIIFFKNKQENEVKDKFFSSRSITVKGYNVNVSGLIGNTSMLSTNEIYLKWLEITSAELYGNKLIYPEKEVYIADDLKTFESIPDFIMSDLIKISGYVMQNYCDQSYPNIIEKIDFLRLMNVITDTTNLNHRRLCVEFCKYYCGFYGNELLIEDNRR